MFSGGTYEEVARWLRNFLTSHAKRVHPRIEVDLDSGEAREGRSYGARLRLGDRVSDLIELDYKDVADQRGTLAWCSKLANRTRDTARLLLAAAPADDVRAR
jgi:hypothetical protein